MLIAVSAEGMDLKSRVSTLFEGCKCILIVNMDDRSVCTIQNAGEPDGVRLAKEIAASDCEAVITGELGAKAFTVLADAGVTRYNGAGHIAGKALSLMDQYKLEYIRVVEGIEECESHSGDSCESHRHE